MKIPCLDTLVYRTFWALDRLGRIRTIRDLAAVDLKGIRSILVAVTTALGDSVTFTPALTALRERCPLARIVGLFHKNFAELYLTDPRLDAVILYHGKYLRWHKTLNALRAERCELALVPYINDPDVIPLIYLGGSRIIFRTPGRDTIYRFMVANPELLSGTLNAEHALVRCATMLRHLGCAISDLAPKLYVAQSSRERTMAWLRAHGIPPGVELVGMHPGASIREKRWPAENFVEVAQTLLRENIQHRVILTGSVGERALCEHIRAACRAPDRVVNAAGEVPLADLPALLEQVMWLLTNDTGVAHIAYATDTPSLTLFWRGDPAISGPMHNLNRHQVIACQPLCPPCRPRTCRYPACAKEITPKQVLEAALPRHSGTVLARRTGMGA